MKKDLFFNYLLKGVFLLVLLNSCKNFDEKKVEKKQQKVPMSLQVLKDSLYKLQEERFDYQYFDVRTNENAMVFFERNGIKNPNDFVLRQVMATNISKEKTHPLIAYVSRFDKKFQINKVKILNQRWVICDFTDGTDWGELLLRYWLKSDNKTLDFKVYDQILYVNDQK